MATAITEISIRGYKSIERLERLPLRPLNVLVGANGAGKSNLLDAIGLLRDLANNRLQLAVQVRGGADTLLHLGSAVTRELNIELEFGGDSYRCDLVPTADNRLVIGDERLRYTVDGSASTVHLGANRVFESGLQDQLANARVGGVHALLSGLAAYHFDDTSPTAGVRRWGAINDDERLRPDASNLAAYLHRLAATHPRVLAEIRGVVRLAAPFFDDFNLRPIPTNPDQIQLEWKQVGSDRLFRPSEMSDGTLRFICLATALLQPSPPATLLFDEPELGVHPFAMTLLAELLKGVTFSGCQVIIATQSPVLLNEFDPEDIVVVDRSGGRSTFRRLTSAELREWLADYSIGDLWQKNVFGGGFPAFEASVTT